MLPPIGEINDDNESELVTYISELAQEGADARDPYIQVADMNRAIYEWGVYPAPTSILNSDCISNDIQDAITAITDIQTKDRPTILLTPVETSEPGQIFLADHVDADGVALPLDPEMIQLQLLQDQENAAMGIPTAPIEPIEIDDQAVSDVYQTVFDLEWKRSNIDRDVREFVLWNNVFGYQLMLYEWDEERKQHKITDLSPREVYMDPTKAHVEDMQFVGIERVLEVEQAKAMFPEFADEIQLKAASGMPSRPFTTTEFGYANDRNFKRRMVTLATFWIRDQQMAMTPDEAIERGLVSHAGVNDEEVAQESGAAQPILPNPEESSVVGPVGAGDDGESNPEVDGAESNGDVDAGTEATQTDASPGETGDGLRDVVPGNVRALPYRLSDGAEADIDHPLWPKRYVIRQVTIIDGIVVDDRECGYWDMPILHSVCIPLKGSPFGQGMPQKLYALQRADNKVLNGIADHMDAFGHPIQVMPLEMYEWLKKETGDTHVKPGQTLAVPNQLFKDLNGKIAIEQQPPQLPPASIEAHSIFEKKLTERSGHSEVLQGRTQSKQSGRAIELLQSAATSLIGFQSQWTSDMLNRLARLCLHSLVWRLEPADLFKIVSKYPLPVLAAIHRRARNMDWDIDVTVATGTGQVLARKRQEKLDQFSVQDPNTGETVISMETLRETLGVDNRQESERNQRAMAPVLERQAQQAAMEAAGKGKAPNSDAQNSQGAPPTGGE